MPENGIKFLALKSDYKELKLQLSDMNACSIFPQGSPHLAPPRPAPQHTPTPGWGGGRGRGRRREGAYACACNQDRGCEVDRLKKLQVPFRKLLESGRGQKIEAATVGRKNKGKGVSQKCKLKFI